MTKHLVLLDFTWIDRLGGHSFEYDRNILTAFAERGWSRAIYANRDCRLTEVAGVPILPAFTYATTSTIVRPKLLRPPAKLLAHLTVTAKEIRDVILYEDAANTVFYAQHTEAYHLLALTRALPKTFRGTIVVMLRVTSLRTANGRTTETFRTLLYRLAFRRLARWRSQVLLITDSERLQSEYRQLTDMAVSIVPHPNPPPRPSGIPIRHERGALRLTVVGRLSTEKGSQFLPDVMCNVHRAALPVTFALHIHCDPDSEYYIALQARIRAQAKATDILIETPLSTSDYWRQLEAADAVLLLYDPSRYRNQISGVLMDALAAGCYPIVTDHTWVAQIVRHIGFGTVVTLDDRVCESIVDVLRCGLPTAVPPSVTAFVKYNTRDTFFNVFTTYLDQRSP